MACVGMVGQFPVVQVCAGAVTDARQNRTPIQSALITLCSILDNISSLQFFPDTKAGRDRQGISVIYLSEIPLHQD
jgi:hypothetical protein